MAKYVLILGGADVDKRAQNNAALAPALLDKYMTWLRGMRDSGRYNDGFKLHDRTGRRLTVRSGQVIDGPFVETKEAVGGVVMIEAASLDEASEIAKGCPILAMQNGYVEVRMVEDVPAVAR